MRRLIIALGVAVPLAVGVSVGWQQLWSRPCNHVQIQGVQYTDEHDLTALISDTLEAHLVADRLRRHPWVRTADAICYPTGTMRAWVHERVPRVLVIAGDGTPAYFMDKAGFMMPATTRMAFDVPVVRGLSEPYRPLKPAEGASTRELLSLLTRLEPSVDSLISEFAFTQRGLELTTTPLPSGASARVRLGHQGWDARLRNLRAYWTQQILAYPDRRTQLIDLRFDGQIVTRATL